MIMRPESKDAIKEPAAEAALSLFGEYGFSTVTMEEIAEKAGLPVEEMRACFPSTGEIARYIADHYIDPVFHRYRPTHEDIRRQLVTTSPGEVLVRFILSHHQKDPRTEPLLRFLFMEQYAIPHVGEAILRNLLQSSVDYMRDLFDFLVELEAIPPCDSEALAQLWVRTILVFHVFVSHADNFVDFEDFFLSLSLLVNIAVRGVRPIPASRIELRWDKPRTGGEGEDQILRRICGAALDQFEERGYSRTSMGEIAERCGPEVDLYKRFRSKDAIIRHISGNVLNHYKHYQLYDPAFQAVLQSKDPFRLVLDMSTSYPPVEEGLSLRAYRLLFREQYHDETIKDYFIGSIYRDRYTIADTLERLVAEDRIRPCESWKIASVFTHTMSSMSIETSVFPHRARLISEMRVRIAAPLISLILYGYLS